MDDETYEALGEGSKLSEAWDAIENFDIDSLHDDLDYNYLRLFVKLYQEGLLELRVAAIRNGNGIFHRLGARTKRILFWILLGTTTKTEKNKQT